MFFGVDTIIFLFCLIGCGITTWNLGHRDGVEDAVQYFIDNGVIDVDEEADEL